MRSVKDKLRDRLSGLLGKDREKTIYKGLSATPFWLSSLSMLLVLFDFGFDQSATVKDFLQLVYIATIIAGALSIPSRYISGKSWPRVKIWIADGIILALIITYLSIRAGWITIVLPGIEYWIYPFLLLVFIREMSVRGGATYTRTVNPAHLFLAGFLIMIITGSVILILPNATIGGISYIDALFTSTSAVCVTGLTVVDTGTHFTLFGQIIILILIQLGGLGIMTFTSYFSYFFRGSTSYHNQLLLKDLTNSEKLAGVFNTLKRVILVTFLIEAIGAAVIYNRIDPALYPQTDERLFFALFHSVSAFCNAGFSTLPDSLFTEGFRYNYSLHIIIASLFITGGLGFPILFNFLHYFRHLIVNRVFSRRKRHIPWVININTRIVIITTAILLTGGTVLFLMLEYNNTLNEYDGAGKIAVAFFTAATPRTAGFNAVNTSALTMPAMLICGILMWIGASPGSTGGGIKTSTLAIAILNTISIARGKEKTEIYNREISDRSIKRALSIIVLSLLVISASVLLISLTEKEIEFHKIVFESVSAFSTSGLSLGITSGLGSTAKLILILTMFTGRVSMMTILAAIMKKVDSTGYRYPAEDIQIN